MACSEVAKDLKANLCAYDYTGYGQSKGRASIPDTIADIDAVFQWLLRRDIDKQDIILYGQSLGSGPTLDLAARERYIGGVVLHAAFASGVRVHLLPGLQRWQHCPPNKLVLPNSCQDSAALAGDVPRARVVAAAMPCLRARLTCTAALRGLL